MYTSSPRPAAFASSVSRLRHTVKLHKKSGHAPLTRGKRTAGRALKQQRKSAAIPNLISKLGTRNRYQLRSAADSPPATRSGRRERAAVLRFISALRESQVGLRDGAPNAISDTRIYRARHQNGCTLQAIHPRACFAREPNAGAKMLGYQRTRTPVNCVRRLVYAASKATGSPDTNTLG